MRPARGDSLRTAAQAAREVGVTPRTIRNWRDRGLCFPTGLNERGWELYDITHVRRAESQARAIGLERIGTDPRKLRKPKPRARAA